MPHIIFFFNIAIVWVMLWIEARRYRFYDAFRARVRMLEAHFLVPIVAQNTTLLQGEWQKLVCEDLLLPVVQDQQLRGGRAPAEAQLRLHLHHHPHGVDHENLPPRQPEDHLDFHSFYAALRVGTSIPSWLVAFVFVGTFASVISIVFYIGKKTTGEISEFGTHRSLWRL